MKKTIYLFALIGLTLVSCKKDKDPEPEPEPTPTPTPTVAANGTIRATIDGTVFNSTALSTMCVWNGNGYSMQGVGTENGVSKNIAISFKCAQNAAVGTYAISGANNLTDGFFVASYMVDTLNYSTVGQANSTGTLTVTEFNSSTGISGTFSFGGAKLTTGTGIKEVTSGSFTKVKLY